MTFTRRALLRTAMLASTACAVTRLRATGTTSLSAVQQPVAAKESFALRLFDGSSSASVEWLGGAHDDCIDTVGQNATRWRQLRDSRVSGRVAGLTGWSDFVQARGLLEQQGKRLRIESRSGNLFYWEMA